ncbi:glycosyltransferase family 1 protein [Mucilaginibacter galii]|nr:glycosyltransferase family 1 protein [Mucilaginibacter galii]
MINPNSGYFSFGKGLGDAMIQQNAGSANLTYYVFKDTDYQFEGMPNLLYLSKWHQLYFPQHHKFDLVHFTDQRCRLKPGMVKGKKVLTIHDINKVHLNKSKPWRIKAHVNKINRYIAQCDRVVTISQFVANDILKFCPAAQGKISVIYNGADKLVVPDNHTPAYVPQKPFLFTIGLLSPQKGFHLLPALLANNDYELIIAGPETPHKAVILQEAEKYNCLDRVKVTGAITDDDKAWYYKNCSAFIFPSKTEGFGLPVIEAMYFGKPVFLSKYTSLPEVGGDVAYYFDNFEPEHMQQGFNKGMQRYVDEDRSGAIIAHAEQFSWEKTAQQYLALYAECLKTGE